jgi:butyryl-CoA dehydrogenase
VAAKFFSERNIAFLLYEVFDLEALTRFPYYRSHNRKAFDMVLKAAGKLAKELLFPIFAEMDRRPPELSDGRVKVHPGVPKILREFGEGGWLTSRVALAHDGEQLPHLVADACEFIFSAANYSAAAYAGLIVGAAHLIESFGGRELYDTYVPKMRAGLWQGTMALTEPEAGSSLSDITTTAEPTPDGWYSIRGQKIFISAGDHDGVENVVHLMLAKIPGAPAGVKGISLFVVPKHRVEAGGRLVPNDVATAGVYHKMGYRGCPIVQLSMGDRNDCRGFLVGRPHEGLRCMFQMMNEARIGVGIGATALATAAYYAALEYARARRQGRPVSQKDPARPPVPIIEHADVKRMLLFQRAVAEGALGLLAQCSRYVDLQKAVDGADREKYDLLLEILTPVAKSYPSEMGILAISQGLQCLGGSGYCEDYPLEQYYRDCRIHPIHEGTTGIQGMDLLGRKVLMQNGRAFDLFLEEVRETLREAAPHPALEGPSRDLEQALQSLTAVTAALAAVLSQKGVEFYLADATLYLEMFGIVTIAWQWLKQGVAVQNALARGARKADADFYQGKMFALRYFFAYEVPRTLGLAKRLAAADGLTVEMTQDMFLD